MDYAERGMRNRISWQGINFILTNPASNFTLLTPEDTHCDATSVITDLSKLAIAIIKEIHLPQFETKMPNFACAVVPSSQFL